MANMHNPAINSSHRQLPLLSRFEILPTVKVHDSIISIGLSAWNACFAEELEDYHYLLAVEQAGVVGFAWRYITIEEHGKVIVAMPAFLTDYPLDTTLEEGMLRRALRRIRAFIPRFLMMKLACLGSPVTENGRVGFHESIPESRKAELLAQLMDGFFHYAQIQGYRLWGVKDIASQHKRLWDEVAKKMGFSPMTGLATAHLDINFTTLDGYLELLSKETRKDMRRKLKSCSSIRMEIRSNIDDVLPRVLALYQDTKDRSEFQFEDLPEEYFRHVLAQMDERAMCVLYFYGDTLLAANLLLKNDTKLLDKFFCMQGVEGRKHNLYFLSWFTNLEYCLANGISHYQSGQACYGNKLRLKCHLNTNDMYFKHANPWLNAVLRKVAPLFEMRGEEVL